MLAKQGDLLFDYASDNSQFTVNVRKDILNYGGITLFDSAQGAPRVLSLHLHHRHRKAFASSVELVGFCYVKHAIGFVPDI